MTAIGGGLVLILAPEGQLAGMSPEGLTGTVFTNYLVPGLSLLVGIGFFSIYTAILFITRYLYSPVFLVMEGIFLMIWIVVQMLAFSKLSFLQPLYGLTGITMLLFGFLPSIKFPKESEFKMTA